MFGEYFLIRFGEFLGEIFGDLLLSRQYPILVED